MEGGMAAPGGANTYVPGCANAKITKKMGKYYIKHKDTNEVYSEHDSYPKALVQLRKMK